MRSRLVLFATMFLLVSASFVAAERINCSISQSNPDPSTYSLIDNVTTQGHYSGGTVYALYCSRNWPAGTGNVSFRYVDPGHVQSPSYDTFPNDKRFGRSVNCSYEAGGGGTCSDAADVCAFAMSDEDNAHIADCSQDNLPGPSNYNGTLCCKVEEICTNGRDDDGDGLVDCADPECNGADASTALEPTSDDGPQICHPPSQCPQTVHVGLKGYWQFENTTNDSTTNENDGSLNGASYTNQLNGRLGQALDLDTSDTFDVPDDTGYYNTLDPSQGITLSAYVYPEVSTGGIIAKGTAYKLYMSGGDLYVDLDGGSIASLNIGSVPNDEWTHVAATYNASTGDVTGYIDGSQTASATSSGSLPDSASNLQIGYDGSNYWEGRIDQARLYSRELTGTEVSSFTNYKCQNRQRTIECVNNPELCDTNYTSADANGYHCNFGKYDDPTNTDYEDAPRNGTGVCCPKDEFADYDPFVDEWDCVDTNPCGVESGDACETAITSNESAWFADRSDGNNNACNSQVNDLYEDDDETTEPEGSQACCYVPKKGKLDYWYKDGNVKIYG